MLAPPGPWSALVGWLLETSFQAGLLICAVLGVRGLAGRRISAQWRHALWLLVLLRLVLPWTPESRFSVYGLVPNPIPGWLAVGGFTGAGPADRPDSAAGPAKLGATDTLGGAGDRAEPAGGGPMQVIVVVWLIGAAGFASWLLVQALATVLAFHGRRPVTGREILDLLEDCKEELAIHTYLAVVETPRVRAPALFGWIRPRLLLPAGVLDTLSRGRLRHVFLHELAHLKRHDIALNWLMTLVQALHWFNPLVWLAFQRARADMELACDELALSRLPDHESADYGHTILELLSTWAEPKRLPMLAAIAEDVNQVKRRIQMVAAFNKGQHPSHWLPAAILLLLGAVFMVDARDSTALPQGQKPEQRASAPLWSALGGFGIPDTVGSVQSNQAEGKTPPIDAAMKSAAAWLVLVDARECGQAWSEAHSVARGMISREAFVSLCEDMCRAETAERGKALSRKVTQVEYQTGLPMGLGDGISVRFASSYEKGEYAGPKLLLAKDRDGVWRLVRSDKE